MKFYAISDIGVILTDDYSDSEIERGKHIDNLKSDLEYLSGSGIVRIYDETGIHVCDLVEKGSSRKRDKGGVAGCACARPARSLRRKK